MPAAPTRCNRPGGGAGGHVAPQREAFVAARCVSRGQSQVCGAVTTRVRGLHAPHWQSRTLQSMFSRSFIPTNVTTTRSDDRSDPASVGTMLSKIKPAVARRPRCARPPGSLANRAQRCGCVRARAAQVRAPQAAERACQPLAGPCRPAAADGVQAPRTQQARPSRRAAPRPRRPRGRRRRASGRACRCRRRTS